MIISKMKKLNSFTLAEVMIVFAIIAIITVFWIGITKSKLDFATQMTYYATANNLKSGAGNLIAEGYKDSDGTLQKALPEKGNDSTNQTGFCNRLADLYNTEGTPDCTKTIAAGTTDFSSATPNFKLSNGSILYNVGQDALNITPPQTGSDDSTLNGNTEKNNLLNYRTNAQNQISGAEDIFLYEHMPALCTCATNNSCTNIKLDSMTTDESKQWPPAYSTYLSYVQQALNEVENFIKGVITDAIKAAGLKYSVNNVAYVYQQIITNSSTVNADTNTLNSYFDKYTIAGDAYEYDKFNCEDLATQNRDRCENEPVMDQSETARCEDSYTSAMNDCEASAASDKIDQDTFWSNALNYLNGTYTNDIIAAATPYFPSMPEKSGGVTTAKQGYFDVFVDVNGSSKGKSKLDNDVFEFYITRSGSVYPAKTSAAANDTNIAKARIYYKAHTSDVYASILKSNLTYRQAFCESNTVEQQLIDKMDYCSGYTADTTNCPTDGNTCKVILTKPGY